MEKLLEKLNKKFDEYHHKQLEIDDPQNPDYYLFMGKANAIGEAIDLIEELISNKVTIYDFLKSKEIEYPALIVDKNFKTHTLSGLLSDYAKISIND